MVWIHAKGPWYHKWDSEGCDLIFIMYINFMIYYCKCVEHRERISCVSTFMKYQDYPL